MAMCLIFGMGTPPLALKATKSSHPSAFVIDGEELGEVGMKFMLTFAFKPEARGRDEAIARFKKTGGQPPHGAKLLGRWTAADFSGGFDLLACETVSSTNFFTA